MKIEVLGPLAIVLPDGSRVEHFHTRKAAALLGYLALFPGKPHLRELLIDMLWPEVEPKSGRNSLSVALSTLRPYLGSALITHHGQIQLQAERVSIDLTSALETQRRFDPDTLLLGFYDDFVITERERLKAQLASRSHEGSSTTAIRPILPGGAVPLHAGFYIERATDGELLEALQCRDSIILLKGAHEVGKTSLLARGVQAARLRRARVALTDLSTLPTDDAMTFFLALATSLADELGGEETPETKWSQARSPAMNLERFVRNVALEIQSSSIIWALDEVDCLFDLPFGTDLFRLFRSWHNRRSLEPDGPWSQLTLIIAYATEAQFFLTDLHQSPFNVGTHLSLADFTLEETTDLNRRFGSPLKKQEDILILRECIGGQPYLNHLAFHALSRGLSLEKLLSSALSQDGTFGGHLRRLSVSLEPYRIVPSLMDANVTLSQEDFYRLRASGLLAGEYSKKVTFRCRLYRDWLLQGREK